MLSKISFTGIFPTVFVIDEEKKMIPGIIIVEEGTIKVGVFPSVFLEKTIDEYIELKKRGYKPVNFDINDVAKMLRLGIDIVDIIISNTILEQSYGEELKDKINELLRKELFEKIKNIKRDERDSMVR